MKKLLCLQALEIFSISFYCSASFFFSPSLSLSLAAKRLCLLCGSPCLILGYFAKSAKSFCADMKIKIQAKGRGLNRVVVEGEGGLFEVYCCVKKLAK